MGALVAAGWGGLGAVALVIGAWLSLRFGPSSGTVGLILGFGSGALLGAIAYELVPRERLTVTGTFIAVAAGALVFYAADRLVTGRHRVVPGTRGSTEGGGAATSIALGALLDGVPESLVLGMGLATGGTISIAFLVAVFVSNLPEALGSSSALRDAGHPTRRIYQMWWGIVAISALCAGLGYGVIRLLPGADGGYVEAFAAGAVLTMLADSMIPEAYRERGKLTGLLTVLGFVVAGALTLAE